MNWRIRSGPAVSLALAVIAAAVSLKLSATATRAEPSARCERLERLRRMAIDEATIDAYIARYGRTTRQPPSYSATPAPASA